MTNIDQTITENNALISESVIVDSCGIISHQSSVELSDYKKECVNINETSRDKEDMILPVTSQSNRKLVMNKNEETNENEGIKHNLFHELSKDEAYLERHELKGNKTQLG